MKKTKITYWITTGIFSAMMLFSATMYFTSPQMAQTFEHLGFPDYFRIELGIAKIIGVLLLLAPFTGRLKEWVYAGFTINMISGSIAHAALGDPTSATLTPLVFLGILAASYVTYNKLDEEIEPTFVKQLIASTS
ncbi:DoxX family protein [Aliifodinibius sp. S!AR15-10]|uniref:DoxX family protein n=1 Tax=Aliifodinibius sp. S!AR15-10 TaxID=2950437 RepID=UPI002856258F|nr:DoxX family protein [Aliifodinibius sp. S!AR15-10]MDR8390789.1 DoxX family protein [Aliifodinibius sp. S!AR15-10]